ncbi:G-box-binding factor 3 [Morus notabilis]|nr:G-box-binding factor 3 [Morus notabilis]
MEQGLAKKLKGSDGLPIQVGCDNPQSDVSQSLERDVDGMTDGSNGSSDADKFQMNNGAESKQSSDIDVKAYTQVNSSIEEKVNETSTDLSDNTMLPVFIGYVGSQCEKAGNTPTCATSSGIGFPSDALALALDERQLKRERRKQANRESAKKSRLRKQAEYEELLTRWESLNAENAALKCELEQLKGDSGKLRHENAALMEKLEVRGLAQKGETVSSNVEADLTLRNNTEKVPNNSITLNRNVKPDRNTHESSNSETKLHQLLGSSSRTDTVAAR